MPKPGRNFVGEWFGHRVYPQVAEAPEALRDQRDGLCPFLSAALAEDKRCIKAEGSFGVCTITTTYNGVKDWLVCPYRALDVGLLDRIVRRSFRYAPEVEVTTLPAVTLAAEGARDRVRGALAKGRPVVVFFQDKLGGEVGLPGTEETPELSFDIVLVELQEAPAGPFGVGRYAILEVQTMDFHGSYQKVVRNLSDALRLHEDGFHKAIAGLPFKLSEDIEGPNIANVFKRTLYQILLKFRLAESEKCAGATLMLPRSVWTSWQPHLGRPTLTSLSPGQWSLLGEGEPPSGCWIDVLDVDTTAAGSPQPLVVGMSIATSAAALARCAFEDVPRLIAEHDSDGTGVLVSIAQRLARWWPAADGGPMQPKRRPRPQRLR